jgi:RNA polymerase sigma-70 factor (ECF subfamily)
MVASRRAPDAHVPGREIGLSELFDAEAAYVWNTLRRLGVPSVDLEDATHDVFMQVQRHFDSYDPTRAVRPWLFGFAFRIASQRRRRAYRRYETPLAPEHDVVDSAAPPDERIAKTQDQGLVMEALETLDLDRRAIFVLSTIDEVPMQDIANTLSIPVNTAYSRLRAAREEFAAAIKRLLARRGDR